MNIFNGLKTNKIANHHQNYILVPQKQQGKKEKERKKSTYKYTQTQKKLYPLFAIFEKKTSKIAGVLKKYQGIRKIILFGKYNCI